MRAVIQRVNKAEVKVDGKIIGQISSGLLVLLAIHTNDDKQSIIRLADKIINLRIFSDQEDKMNLSLLDIKSEILVVSQFTLYGDTKKGNRPSFIESARPDKAIPYYEKFVSYLRDKHIKVETGKFGAMMEVGLVNEGPVTIILDI
jgi:D-aminoacyl-tRNA deacylase